MEKKELTQIEFAQLGGKAKFAKYGKKAYSDMGKKSGESRRAKKLDKSAIHKQNVLNTLQTASS